MAAAELDADIVESLWHAHNERSLRTLLDSFSLVSIGQELLRGSRLELQRLVFKYISENGSRAHKLLKRRVYNTRHDGLGFNDLRTLLHRNDGPHNAVRLVSKIQEIDVKLAFQEALTLVREEGKQANRMPRLLCSLDENRALDELVGLAVHATVPILKHIGIALDECEGRKNLTKYLSRLYLGSSKERLAAIGRRMDCFHPN